MLGTALISGFGLGSIYGLIALGFTLTFSVSGTVNFAQGSSVMLGAVLCHVLFVGMHWPFVAAAFLALLGCALWGLVVERIAVRPFVARHPSRQFGDGVVRQGAARAAFEPRR
jgi:branched-chain amino acid transport system permease protein